MSSFLFGKAAEAGSDRHSQNIVKIYFICALLFFTLIGCVVSLHLFYNAEERAFTHSGESFGNPLIGYAPCAWYDEVSEDINLLYMDITWRELEPEEGKFDWEAIEEENQLERWRREGKHIVLRFVCDIPDDEPHMDIPDWLYEKTNGAGTIYDISYGRGFSPDYGNEVFIAAHKKAIAAMGKRYGQDGFISYVELGSLGHWGEWHVKYSDGITRIPLREIREQYVAAWVQAFPNAKIMMRRPFAEAKQHGLGLFNDMAGHAEDTLEWLDWIDNGGSYSQTGETDAVVPMPDFWKSAPVGGELTSSFAMSEMLERDLARTTALIRDSHTTFLGPKIADDEYREGYDALLLNMGYRLWVSEAKLTPKLRGGIGVTLDWQNSGVAPFYEDWPVYLYVLDSNNELVEQRRIDMTLTELMPEESLQTKTTLHSISGRDDLQRYKIAVGIVDPMTKRAAVRLAMADTERLGALNVIF